MDPVVERVVDSLDKQIAQKFKETEDMLELLPWTEKDKARVTYLNIELTVMKKVRAILIEESLKYNEIDILIS